MVKNVNKMKKRKIGIKDFIFHLQGDRVQFTPNTDDPELADLVAMWRKHHPEVDNDRTAVGLMYIETVKRNTTATAREIVQAIEAGRYEMKADDLLDAALDDAVNNEKEMYRYGQSYIKTVGTLAMRTMPQEVN